MKNMKNILLMLTSVLLLIVIVYLMYRYQQLDEQYDNAKQMNSSLSASMDGFLKNIIEQEISSYKMSGIELKGNEYLLDSLKNTSYDTLFVFRFSDRSCETCIDNALLDLSRFGKFSKNRKFLIITDFKDSKRYKNLANQYKNKYFFVNIKSGANLYLKDKDEYLSPMFFVLTDGDLVPKKLFFYLKELPKLNTSYFEMIQSEYFH